MKQIGKMGAVTTAILLAGLLSFFLWKEYQYAEREKEIAVEMEKELRPFELERAAINRKLEDLEKEFNGNVKSRGSLIILFSNLNKEIYDEAYPQMKEYGFVGTLALSETQRPGKPGCLSQEQFNELINEGWKCCLRWETDSEQAEWLAICDALAGECGIARPGIVYFPYDTYKNEKDEFLMGNGVGIVIQHGEEDRSLIMTESEEGIWHPGAVAYSQDEGCRLLAETMNQKGNLIYTVGSDSEEEVYEQDKFGSMLAEADKYVKSENLLVTDLQEARKYHEQMKSEKEKLENGYLDQKEELENQLKEVEDKMDIVTEKYLQIADCGYVNRKRKFNLAT